MVKGEYIFLNIYIYFDILQHKNTTVLCVICIYKKKHIASSVFFEELGQYQERPQNTDSNNELLAKSTLLGNITHQQTIPVWRISLTAYWCFTMNAIRLDSLGQWRE